MGSTLQSSSSEGLIHYCEATPHEATQPDLCLKEQVSNNNKSDSVKGTSYELHLKEKRQKSEAGTNENSKKEIIKIIGKFCALLDSNKLQNPGGNTSKKNVMDKVLVKVKKFVKDCSPHDLMNVESAINSMIDKVNQQKGSRFTGMLRNSKEKIAGLNNKISLLKKMNNIVDEVNLKHQCIQRLSTLRPTPDRMRRSMELREEIGQSTNREKKIEKNASFVQLSPWENQRNNNDPILCVRSDRGSIISSKKSDAVLDITSCQADGDPDRLSSVCYTEDLSTTNERQKNYNNLQDSDENQRPCSPDEGFFDGDSPSSSPVCCSILTQKEHQSSENLLGSTNRKRKTEENISLIGQSPEKKKRYSNDLLSMQSENLKKSEIKSKTPLIIAGSCAVMAVAISVYLEMVMIGTIAAMCISVIGIAGYCCNGNKEQIDHKKESELVNVQSWSHTATDKPNIIVR